jgi:hypothetical protein
VPGLRVMPSRRSRGQAITCRPTTLSDFDQIHALERRHRLGFKTYDEWAHMWVNNPVCLRRPDLPIGWVLENNQGQIVGSIGSIPFAFELDGRQLIAGTSSAWVIDDQYRAFALQLLDRFFSQPDVDLHLGISPNHDAEPGVALQSERVPAGVWNRAAFWITNSPAFVNAVLAKRGVRHHALLRYPVGGALAVHQALKRDRLKAALQSVRSYEVKPCTAFDDRFDEFWDALRRAHPNRLLAIHDRETLDWHFRYPLARGRVWISTVVDDGRLAAYAVFCRKDVAGIGLRRVRLLDYQSRDGDPTPLLPILADALDRCQREGTSVLESIGWRLEPEDFMDRLAPYFRTLPSWQYYYKAATPALAGVLKDRAVWNPSQYDGDTCL